MHLRTTATSAVSLRPMTVLFLVVLLIVLKLLFCIGRIWWVCDCVHHYMFQFIVIVDA